VTFRKKVTKKEIVHLGIERRKEHDQNKNCLEKDIHTTLCRKKHEEKIDYKDSLGEVTSFFPKVF
jgi:hypothetical protein